jgi:hypothetical protein
VRELLLGAQARQEALDVEDRMRATVEAAAARKRAERVQLGYIRGAVEQAADEGAAQAALVDATNRATAAAEADAQRMKSNEHALQAKEAESLAAADALKSGMNDLKEAVAQARPASVLVSHSKPLHKVSVALLVLLVMQAAYIMDNGGSRLPSDGGVLATAIAISDAVQKMQAALVQLQADRDSVSAVARFGESLGAQSQSSPSFGLAAHGRGRGDVETRC